MCRVYNKIETIERTITLDVKCKSFFSKVTLLSERRLNLQDCIPVGCIPYLPAWTAQGGVCFWEDVCFWGMGVCFQGVSVNGGVCPGGWYPSVH